MVDTWFLQLLFIIIIIFHLVPTVNQHKKQQFLDGHQSTVLQLYEHLVLYVYQ